MKSLQEYCVENGMERLLREWHPERNLPLSPRDISHGSTRMVWWRCDKGHDYQMAVHTRTEGCGCPYCAGKRVLSGKTDLASQYPYLATQWHPDKNGSLTPEQVLPGSHRKVWWICEKGHEWQAIVKSRAEGNGCPICANRRLLVGLNDLATVRPDLAKQWDPEKNGALTPQDVLSVSNQKVWWRCEKGHSWQAAVRDRVHGGTGCPICSGKTVLPGETDFQSRFPDLAKQWHPTKNGSLTPDHISPYSNRRIWWLCERGHEYQAQIYIRTSGSGCPYCAGKKVLPGFNDLATLEPETAKQWHPTLNGTLTPDQVTLGSHKMVWWQCAEGHTWKAAPYSRTGPKRRYCPYCAGIRVWTGFNDLATREPEIAKQWHPTLNGSLTPETVMPGSHKNVWWQCQEGHVWKAAIYSRTGNMRRGCPVCAGKVKDRYAHLMEQQQFLQKPQKDEQTAEEKRSAQKERDLNSGLKGLTTDQPQ